VIGDLIARSSRRRVGPIGFGAIKHSRRCSSAKVRAIMPPPCRERKRRVSIFAGKIGSWLGIF